MREEEEEHLCRLSRDDKKGDFVNDDDDDVDMLERKKISTVLKKCRFRSATNNTPFLPFLPINRAKKKKKRKKKERRDFDVFLFYPKP